MLLHLPTPLYQLQLRVALQAGGSATDGIQRIVEKQIDSLHQRVPLVFGSKDEVKLIESYYTNASGSHHPLFKKRQLLRE